MDVLTLPPIQVSSKQQAITSRRPTLQEVIDWLYRDKFLPGPGTPALMGVALDTLPVMYDMDRPVNYFVEADPYERRWLNETIFQSARLINPGRWKPWEAISMVQPDPFDPGYTNYLNTYTIYGQGNGIFTVQLKTGLCVFALPEVNFYFSENPSKRGL